MLAFPRDDGELLRIATLSSEDLTFIGQHRGDHNQLGVGVQLYYLRHPRPLGYNETPHLQLLNLVAAQLRISASVWDLYAHRDQTRRDHLQEISERLGLKQFDRIVHREIAKWLLPTALQTTQGLMKQYLSPIPELVIRLTREQRGPSRSRRSSSTALMSIEHTSAITAVSEQMALQAPPELLGIRTNMPATVPADVAKALQLGAQPQQPELFTQEIRAAFKSLRSGEAKQ